MRHSENPLRLSIRNLQSMKQKPVHLRMQATIRQGEQVGWSCLILTGAADRVWSRTEVRAHTQPALQRNQNSLQPVKRHRWKNLGMETRSGRYPDLIADRSQRDHHLSLVIER